MWNSVQQYSWPAKAESMCFASRLPAKLLVLDNRHNYAHLHFLLQDMCICRISWVSTLATTRWLPGRSCSASILIVEEDHHGQKKPALVCSCHSRPFHSPSTLLIRLYSTALLSTRGYTISNWARRSHESRPTTPLFDRRSRSLRTRGGSHYACT